jgi:hydroxymethylbilane synthase
LGEDISCEVVGIRTQEMDSPSYPIHAIGGKGVFSSAIHEALQKGIVDCGVHSLKDLEAELPDDIQIAAILEGDDPRDVLITRAGFPLYWVDMPKGFRIGTGSPRRQAQASYLNPAVRCLPIRGNIEKRLQTLADGHVDAIILAYVSLVRLNLWSFNSGDILEGSVSLNQGFLPLIGRILEPMEMLPAINQGMIVVDALRTSLETLGHLTLLHHAETSKKAEVGRGLLRSLQGNCHTCVGLSFHKQGSSSILLKACYAETISTPLRFAYAEGSLDEPTPLMEKILRQWD